MKRLHVHVGVEDLAQSIRFYSTLFAAEPTVIQNDYAKWMLEDPRVNFAISTHGRRVLRTVLLRRLTTRDERPRLQRTFSLHPQLGEEHSRRRADRSLGQRPVQRPQRRQLSEGSRAPPGHRDPRKTPSPHERIAQQKLE
jgi:hypothetical protein